MNSSNPICVGAGEVWVRMVMKLQLPGHCRLLTAPESFRTIEAFFTGRALNLRFPHVCLGWGGALASESVYCSMSSVFLLLTLACTGWGLEHSFYLLIRCLKCQVGRFSSLLSALLVVFYLKSFFFALYHSRRQCIFVVGTGYINLSLENVVASVRVLERLIVPKLWGLLASYIRASSVWLFCMQRTSQRGSG